MTGWTYWTSNLPYFPSILRLRGRSGGLPAREGRRRARGESRRTCSSSPSARCGSRRSRTCRPADRQVAAQPRARSATGCRSRSSSSLAPIVVVSRAAPPPRGRPRRSYRARNLREMVFWTSRLRARRGPRPRRSCVAKCRLHASLPEGAADRRRTRDHRLYLRHGRHPDHPARTPGVELSAASWRPSSPARERIGWGWLVPIMAALLVVGERRCGGRVAHRVGATPLPGGHRPVPAGVIRAHPSAVGNAARRLPLAGIARDRHSCCSARPARPSPARTRSW